MYLRLSPDEQKEVNKYLDLFDNRPDYFNYNHGREYAERIHELLYKEGAKILDIGCGNGSFLDQMKELGWLTYGIDVVPGLLDDQKNIHLGSAMEIPFADDEFDCVTSFDCFEHMLESSVPYAFSEVRRVLYPGAMAVLKIETAPSGSKGVNGEILHPTVKPLTWWQEKSKLFFDETTIKGSLLILRKGEG